MANIIIERCALNVSPTARVNSYNHHSLAPWLAETGYLTPRYMHHRHKANEPFNMAQWLTPKIQTLLLQQPSLVLNFTQAEVITLLEVAATCDRDQFVAAKSPALQDLAGRLHDRLHERHVNGKSIPISHPCTLLPPLAEGYFVRMSGCSPKDVDRGSQLPVNTILDAFAKIAASRRTINALLALHLKGENASMLDARLYFFPYLTSLDRASEWRCFVRRGRVVGVSQSKFYVRNTPGITNEMLERLGKKCRGIWAEVAGEVKFDTCALDLYAEVRKEGFEVRLIEINPGEAHLGTGSLLFHWVDDRELLEGRKYGEDTTVVRLVEERTGGKEPFVDWKVACDIGREGFECQELQSLRDRGLLSVLDPQKHAEFKRLQTPEVGMAGQFCTVKGGLSIIHDASLAGKNGQDEKGPTTIEVKDHSRFKKVRLAYEKELTETR